jgi:membrane protein
VSAARSALQGARRFLASPAGSPRGLALAVARRYVADGMADRAPTLAYYGILSLFPFLLIGFGLIRLVAGADAPDDIANYVGERGWSDALADALRSVTETARSASAAGAGSAGAAGLVTMLYGASRAFTATGRALDVIHRKPSIARSLARRAKDIAWTLVLVLLTIAAAVTFAVSGRVLEDLLGLVGLDEGAAAVWRLARFPAVALLVLLMVAIVRWASPSVQRPFKLITPGIVATVVALGLGSVGFDVYVSQVASYNTTYGAFAGAVILLLWIWLAAITLLLGSELDAVLEERNDAA